MAFVCILMKTVTVATCMAFVWFLRILHLIIITIQMNVVCRLSHLIINYQHYRKQWNVASKPTNVVYLPRYLTKQSRNIIPMNI
jgi:hypothetical protein